MSFITIRSCIQGRKTISSSGDEIANVNFLYDDIVQVLQNTIDLWINSATDRRGGYVLERMFTEFGEITQPLGLLRRSRSFKVTEFGTNRKLPICNFLLVINSNLAPILHRFRDIALKRSKIATFFYSSLV